MAAKSKFLIYVLATVFANISMTAHAADTGNQQSTNSQARLQRSLESLAERAHSGLLGITVIDLKTGEEARVNATQAYPMMSVFKAPVAAAVFAQIDKGQLSLGQEVILTRADVVEGSAVPSIGAHFHGEQMTFKVSELLSAAVSESDNTAVDALVRLVGGPKVVTDFLREHNITGMRVDLDEAGVTKIFEGLEQGGKIRLNETDQEALQRHRQGYKNYLVDPRNRSTPDAAAEFLKKLWRGELLSNSSTQQLLHLMYGQTMPNRLRAGLSGDVRLADKCGTSYSLEGETAAYNDIGIVTWPDGRAVIVAAFLTASRAKKKEMDITFADLARDVVSTFGP